MIEIIEMQETQIATTQIPSFEKPFSDYTVTEFSCFGIFVMLIIVFFFWLFKIRK